MRMLSSVDSNLYGGENKLSIWSYEVPADVIEGAHCVVTFILLSILRNINKFKVKTCSFILKHLPSKKYLSLVPGSYNLNVNAIFSNLYNGG